jgi:peptide/nickel transport system permease protein
MTVSEGLPLSNTSRLPATPRPFILRSLRQIASFARKRPLGFVGGLLICGLLLVALFAPAIAPYGSDEQQIRNRLKAPSRQHLMGTDDLGRDVFSRVIYGARVSVVIGFGAVAVSFCLAGLLGLWTGYFGGLFDLLVQRLVDVWMSLPGLVLMVSVMSIWRGRLSNAALVLALIVGIGVLYSGRASRIVRSVVITLRGQQFVEAAQTLGANHTRVIFHHILPNVIPTMIVLTTIELGSVILVEASLSFLGFGLQPPIPSWGQMLSFSALNFMRVAPWLAIWPGLAIVVTVFSFNIFGDALRDYLDPRLQGTRR